MLSAVTGASPAAAKRGQPASTQILAGAYARLADADPAVRQAAQQQLMRLTLTDLPTLREVAARHQPTPAQVPALRQVVTGVVLASKPYDADQGRGFLGVSLGVVTLEQGRQLVVVESRLPGFVGYRQLRDGDIFIAVTAVQRIAIDSVTRLQQAILGQPAGTHLVVSVLRGGRLVDVPLTLDAVPQSPQEAAPNLAPDPAQFQAMQAGRLKEAQQYWDEHFAPLCGGGE